MSIRSELQDQEEPTPAATRTGSSDTTDNQDVMPDYVADKLESGSGYIGVPETPRNSPLMSSSRAPSKFVVQSVHLRECMAEFLGTFIMICFGMGVNNQVGLSKDANGTWLSINMCWGVAVMLGVHASEGVSGAHLNPAVTFANAVYGKLPWRKVPGYFFAQFIGAFIGAFAIYTLDYQTLNLVDPDRLTSQVHFATYPKVHISNLTAFYTEFLGTLFLVLGVYSITDKRNRPAGPYVAPLAFALLIMAIGMAFGMNTGYAINPARDFGPRLFTCLAGWGTKVFTVRDHYFWIPLVAPLLGGVTGGGLYKVLVEMHIPQEYTSPVDVSGSMV